MIINLATVEFENDFFVLSLPDTSTLILNKIDESLSISEGVSDIKRINVEIRKDENTSIQCTSVIGMDSEQLKISTEYTEYEGEVLTADNMQYCTMEIYEH